MPASYEYLSAAQQLLLDFKDNTSTGSALVERIDEFFQGNTGFEWLTNPDSATFRDAFYNEESSTGWLASDDYNEFWGYAADYADHLREPRDPGQVAILDFPGLPGLTDLLAGVVRGWEAAAQRSATLVDPATIGEVDGYPGWWQGYDGAEGVWKYAKSAGRPAGTDPAEGWQVSAQVDWNAQAQQPAQPEPAFIRWGAYWRKVVGDMQWFGPSNSPAGPWYETVEQFTEALQNVVPPTADSTDQQAAAERVHDEIVKPAVLDAVSKLRQDLPAELVAQIGSEMERLVQELVVARTASVLAESAAKK